MKKPPALHTVTPHAEESSGSASLVEKSRRALRLYWEWQRSEGKLLGIGSFLRRLPPDAAPLAIGGLAGAAIAVIATPILAVSAGRLAGIPFEHVTEGAQSISAPALILSFLLFSLAWGYLLAGAAQGPGVLWILIGLLYVYLFLPIGLTIGRSYLHLLPQLLPIAVAALTREGKRWAKLCLLLIIASVAVRGAPLPPVLRRDYWVLTWIPVSALLVGVHLVLARRPWVSSLARAFFGAAVSAAYLLIIALRAPAGDLAGWFTVSLDSASALLELLWFLLGATFVGGVIEVGQFIHRMADAVVPEPIPRWMPVAALAVLIFLVSRASAGGLAVTGFPAGGLTANPRLWTGAALGVLSIVLAIKWRRSGLSRSWILGWFVTALATVGVLQAYFSLDVSGIQRREANAVTLVAFSYAIAWAVAGQLHTVPLQLRGFGRLSPLLLYLGVVLLVSAASMFGLAANLKFFQEVVALDEYRGAVALWIPLTLLVLVRFWPAVPAAARVRFVHGFALGAILAVPFFLLRAASLIAGDLFLLPFVAVLAGALVSLWPETRMPLPAALLGVAVALGFAVSLSQRVLVGLLHPLLAMIAALGGPRALKTLADEVLRWTSTLPWTPRDTLVFFLIAPALAAAVAAAVGRRQEGIGAHRDESAGSP